MSQDRKDDLTLFFNQVSEKAYFNDTALTLENDRRNNVTARNKEKRPPPRLHPDVLAREVHQTLREIPTTKFGFSNEAIETHLGYRQPENLDASSTVRQTYDEYLEERRRNKPYRSIYTDEEPGGSAAKEFWLNKDEFPPL